MTERPGQRHTQMGGLSLDEQELEEDRDDECKQVQAPCGVILKEFPWLLHCEVLCKRKRACETWRFGERGN